MYVEVAVDFADDNPLKTYTYSTPASVNVLPGDLVWAPFGHRSVQALVLSVSNQAEMSDVRELDSVVEGGPFISEPLLRVGKWIASYYRCGIFRACSLMLPPGANQQLHIWVARSHIADNIDNTIAGLTLSNHQSEVLNHIPHNGKIRRDRLLRLIGRSKERYLDALIRDGVLIAESLWDKPRVKPRLKPHIRLSSRYIESVEDVIADYKSRRAFRRVELVRRLAEEKEPRPRSELSKEFGSTALRAVIDDGVAEVINVQVDRDPLAHYAVQENIEHSLILEQQSAVDAISKAFEKPHRQHDPASGSAGKFLLFGVTGSGKTEVYLRAAEKCVESGKRAIIMVPEIAMTPQTLQRFASRFPAQIALQHSGLSLGQRFDQWHRIKSGEYMMVIGSRSSIFSPVDNLGLVVIDEEHEWTFKQSDRAPRYHAKDVAERLCDETGAVLILGSATPDISTYRRAIGDDDNETFNSKLTLLPLPRRINVALRQERTANQNGSKYKNIQTETNPAQSIQIVDMREEFNVGHREMFSRALLQALQDNVADGGKSILFINRRGSASFIQCSQCGLIRRCPNCNTTLTLHRINKTGQSQGRLRCHYCSYSVGASRRCPNCDGIGIGRRATGTQGVEEAARLFFPNTHILRWDSDTARNAKEHERLLQQFQSEGNHILIGTQMVAKGLDIPDVSLVGVVAADIGLASPSFRSVERTFQILSQVTGRAGRASMPGKSIIQTFQPEHLAIQAAANQDYSGFYAQEIATRQKYELPPFKRYVRLVYASYQDTDAQLEAASVKTRLQNILESHHDNGNDGTLGISIIGPSPTFPIRVAGRYRWQILLKGDDPARILDQLPLTTGWTIDVDPVEMN